jgi:hypothetical protein
LGGILASSHIGQHFSTGTLLKMTEVAQSFWALGINFDKNEKMGWATFWAISS